MKKNKKEAEIKTNNIVTDKADHKKSDSDAGKRKWKETLYNCPFFLLMIMTSAVALLCSDEIGVNLIPVGKAAVVKAVETSGEADRVEAAEEGIIPDKSVIEKDARVSSRAGEAAENPAEDKGEGVEPAAEKEEDNRPGITRFESYEPKQIDSRYYSDAGKVAMTTEYDYETENVSYFNDAAFLGDSRTLGISDYAGLDGADFYCDSGMTIFKLLGEDGVTYQKTGKKVDLTRVLQQEHYGKIYLMLGMNELGYGNTEMYLNQYREVVEKIREWQPDAIIYIMANLHVSEEKNNPETEFNNININDKNAASALLANGTDVFYLDCNPLFTDENGFLNADLTFDGIHLYAQHYDVWRQFLLEHGVERKETEDTKKAIPLEDRKAGNQDNDGNTVE